MRQLDPDTDRKLHWLLTPFIIVVLVFVTDLLFDLSLNALSWGIPAILGCFLIPLIGFSIAYVRQKCWGLLAVTLSLTILMLLNMSNVFVNLLSK